MHCTMEVQQACLSTAIPSTTTLTDRTCMAFCNSLTILVIWPLYPMPSSSCLALLASIVHLSLSAISMEM